MNRSAGRSTASPYSSHSGQSVRSLSFPSDAALSDVWGHLEREVPSTMAIQDRNLSVGTKLYARYKGETYTAEVVLNPEATGNRPIGYKVEGKDQLFKSPSAAGTAITGLACNGWAFWSVGDGAENTGPVTSTKARPPARSASTITPAPKSQSKRRGRKSQTAEPPATDGSDTADEPPA